MTVEGNMGVKAEVKVRQDNSESCGGEGSFARGKKSLAHTKSSSFFQNIFLKDKSTFLQENLGISPGACLNLGITLLIGESLNDQHYANKSLLARSDLLA